MFDVLGKIAQGTVDSLVKLPGVAAEVAAEAVVRVPEIGILAVQGVVTGVERGVDKVNEAARGE